MAELHYGFPECSLLLGIPVASDAPPTTHVALHYKTAIHVAKELKNSIHSSD
ncbi:MAG TPA: hypothetical protein VMU92_05150 [Acidobacteriaceae bacterium]|nr:hypothetical protein [Acidobacteriaceae bacterium]